MNVHHATEDVEIGDNKMVNYTKFLEKYLGEIEYGWSKDSEGKDLSFQVVKYKGGPFPGCVTYSTLGLSREKLISPVSGKQIRHELIFVSYSDFGDQNIPGILQQVAQLAIESKTAYLQGDVIGPYGKMFEGLEMEALYVTLPVYFPESFFVFSGENNIQIVQAWLIPITFKEANFIKKNGWEKFEDLLEELDPDLIDFSRSSIIE